MKKTLLFTGNSSSIGEGWDARFGDFLADLFLEEGLAESTLITLQLQLRAFNNWMRETTGRAWDAATAEDLHTYLLQSLDTQAPSTVRRKQWSLFRLYQWARRERFTSVCTDRAAVHIRAVARTPFVCPAVQQIVQLLQQPDTQTPEGLRDRAILELLYSTGLRAAELLGLEVHQVRHGACVRIMGKGGKERLVVMGEHAQYWIAQYIAIRKRLLRQGGHSVTSTERLFVSRGKHPSYQYQQLRRMVARYARSCGLELTPHKLRHAFATHMYEGKAPLRSIQLLLGHEHLTTTTIYVSRQGMDNKLFMRLHHPRGQDYRQFERWACQ